MKQFNKRRNYKLYQIIGILLLCISFVALSYNISLAWFRDRTITSNGEPNIEIIGTIGLDVTTEFNFYNLALAPDTIYKSDANNDIGTYVKTSAEHNIDGAFVRIKFYTNRPEVTLYFENNLTTASATSNYTGTEGVDKNKWVYNPTDNYYYYLGNVMNTDILFNTGYKVDNTLNNLVAGKTVILGFIVEGLQRQYGAYKAEWTTAPQIFNTFAYNTTGR